MWKRILCGSTKYEYFVGAIFGIWHLITEQTFDIMNYSYIRIGSRIKVQRIMKNIMVGLTFPLTGLLREAKINAGNACGLSML